MAQKHTSSNNEIIAGVLLVVGVLLFILSGNAYMSLSTLTSNGNYNTITPDEIYDLGAILFFGIFGSTLLISSILLFTRK